MPISTTDTFIRKSLSYQKVRKNTKVSDYIVDFLKEHGVRYVFEVSGGMIAHLLDSLSRQADIKVVSVRHEQAAAFAADAVGRITGNPGVALATSGPGAINLMTGIGSCYLDSSPAVFITGQVNRHELKGDRQIRQLGFQEADIVSMVRPITKQAWQVKSPEEIPELLSQAFQIATRGRPGPVLLDIPLDIQRAELPVSEIQTHSISAMRDNKSGDFFWQDLFRHLENAKRPLILAGGGIRSSRSIEALRTFVTKVQVPVVESLMAVGVLPSDDPLHVGMIGSYGNRWANLSVGLSDFLLVLGSRLDIRQTGAKTEAFKGDRVIFHVDCEPHEINNRVIGCRAIVSDLQDFFTKAIGMAIGREFKVRTEWLTEIKGLKLTWPDTRELEGIAGINPNVFMHKLSAVSRKASAYVVDVGQHQMWAAQSLEIAADQQFLTSGGMGSMGFALPAAIGVALTTSPRPCVVIAGDGGLQHNIQELQTVVHHRLPVKIVVINNGCHGMVRQFQESYFEACYQSTLWGYSAPDFERVAAAYGIPAQTVEKDTDVQEALNWLWQDPSQPALLQVMVDQFANAYPKIAFGRPITEMEPFASPIGMEGA